MIQVGTTAGTSKFKNGDQHLTEPALPVKKYTYKSGTQHPADLKITSGSTLDVVLQLNPMIEILSAHQKRNERYFHAVCHSCEKEYKSCTATYLSVHTNLPVHQRRLAAPKDQESVDVKEHSRRQLLLLNPKFSPFLELRDDGQTLWCKWCHLQLPFINAKINDHRYTVTHQASVEDNEALAHSEQERIKKLRKLVDEYPDVLALVDEVDKRINDEIYEYYKTPEEISLQVNDLYCKPCRRKFVRSNPNYRRAVLKHFKTKDHQAALEMARARFEGTIESRLRTVPPPRKISTYKRHLEDLKKSRIQ